MDDRERNMIEAEKGVRRPGQWDRRSWVWLLGGLVLLGSALGVGVIWGEQRAAKKAGAQRADASRPASMPGMPEAPRTGRDGSAGPATTDDAIEVVLTLEAVERAGIKIAVVRSEAAAAVVTVPGTVASNAYRETRVNALVGGIVRQVNAELGATVRRGQPLAAVFSSELADAQMKYLSMRAILDADQQKRARTEKLVALGAASRQELEEVTAVHAVRETEVAAARQRLLLLGLSADRVASLTSASQVVSEVTVPAPADGIVIARSVNPGQVVGAGQELFVVTDLSTVWVIGDLYEKDFPAVRVGSEATVTIPAAPSLLRGRVAYIDPRVEPATRTAKARVEVPNRNGELRLGMFVTVGFQTAGGERRVVVPKGAVQVIGDRTVVYVPVEGDPARFAERTINPGAAVGDFLTVLEGLKPGEKVVSEGSFFLRAEAARSRTGS